MTAAVPTPTEPLKASVERAREDLESTTREALAPPSKTGETEAPKPRHE